MAPEEHATTKRSKPVLPFRQLRAQLEHRVDRASAPPSAIRYGTRVRIASAGPHELGAEQLIEQQLAAGRGGGSPRITSTQPIPSFAAAAAVWRQ